MEPDGLQCGMSFKIQDEEMPELARKVDAGDVARPKLAAGVRERIDAKWSCKRISDLCGWSEARVRRLDMEFEINSQNSPGDGNESDYQNVNGHNMPTTTPPNPGNESQGELVPLGDSGYDPDDTPVTLREDEIKNLLTGAFARLSRCDKESAIPGGKIEFDRLIGLAELMQGKGWGSR